MQILIARKPARRCSPSPLPQIPRSSSLPAQMDRKPFEPHEVEEEQFIFRVLDPALAARIRGVLRDEPGRPQDRDIEVHFDGKDAHVFVLPCAALPWLFGSPFSLPLGYPSLCPFPDASPEGYVTVGGERFPLSVRNLPTIVETYRTLDDENLVKVGDIGQVLLVRPPVRRTCAQPLLCPEPWPPSSAARLPRRGRHRHRGRNRYMD